MSHRNFDQEIEENLERERQVLLDKLSKIFDPEMARDYVCPKTYETRQQLTLDELRRLNYNQSDETLRRLRSLEHYQSTTQSLSRVDLENSYQSFVRNQLAEQSPRYELERFVRNKSDIDAAQRYLNIANDALINPQQSLLLFRSSKLNEQKAHLLKSSGYTTSLQHLNDDPSIDKYFPQIASGHLHQQHTDQDLHLDHQRMTPSTKSIHLEHHEKKYHIEFLKPSNTPFVPSSGISKERSHRSLRERIRDDNVESLFSTELSSCPPRLARPEGFPPLSMSALKEYRPTMTPKTILPRKSFSVPRHKGMRKEDFLWQQTLISSTNQQP